MQKYESIQRVIKDPTKNLQFRPSALYRIVKHSFEFTILRTLLAYGYKFEGFGFMSYCVAKMKNQASIVPYLRTKTLSNLIMQGMRISLPFFVIKELILSGKSYVDQSKVKPSNLPAYCFVSNIISMSILIPITRIFQKNHLKLFRICLAICLFSQATDVYIQYKRRNYINQGQQIKTVSEKFHDKIQILKQKARQNDPNYNEAYYDQYQKIFNQNFDIKSASEMNTFREKQLKSLQESLDQFEKDVAEYFKSKK